MNAMYSTLAPATGGTPLRTRLAPVACASTRRSGKLPGTEKAPSSRRSSPTHHLPFTHSPFYTFTHSLTYPLSPKTHSFLHTQSTQYEYECTATEEVRIRTRTHCIHRGSYLHTQYIHTSYPPLSLPGASVAHASELEADRKTRDASEPRKGATHDHAVTSRAARSPPPPDERARPIW